MSGPATYVSPSFDLPIDLDLSKNEGRSEAADLLSLIDDPPRVISRYPDTSALRARLAELHGLQVDSVLVTAGGDDALGRCFMARVGEGRTVISTRPTFEMISRYAEQRGASLVEIDWWGEAFPVAEVISSITEDTDAVFIVSPNNPTGNAASEADIRKVAAEAPFVVLDAAYVEFADSDPTSGALEMGNVVVTRTMSKAYGLAGLRLGYLLGPPHLVSAIARYGNPYPVAALSAALGEMRLGRPVSELNGFVETVRRERVELTRFLDDLGAAPLPSQANFVLASHDEPDWVVSASAAMGIGLRRFPGRDGLERSIRITVPGDDDDFDRLLGVLGAVLAPEALVFDLDGVLADVSRSQIVAIIETARSSGVEVTGADIEAVKAEGMANDDWEITRRLCADRGVDAPIDEVVEQFETINQGTGSITGLKHREASLVDLDLWRTWQERFPVAVVTGRPRSDAEEFLGRSGLIEGISALVTREDGPLKPDPAPVRRALETLGVGRAWMLGDTPDDLAAARAAGAIPIGVIAPGDDPARARARLWRAARILDKTTDLEGLLP
jgi:histidinol-phosphate aminotransferase